MMYFFGGLLGSCIICGIIFNVLKKVLKKSIPDVSNLRRVSILISALIVELLFIALNGISTKILYYIIACVAVYFIDIKSGEDINSADDRVSLLDQMKDNEKL